MPIHSGNLWPAEITRGMRALRILLEPSFDPSVRLLFWEQADQTLVRVELSGIVYVADDEASTAGAVSKLGYDELTGHLLWAASRTKEVIALDGMGVDIAWRGADKVHDMRFSQVVATTPLASVLTMAVDAALEGLQQGPCQDALKTVRGRM